MIKNILKKLEDPSFPFMGPYVKILHFSGLLFPREGKKRYLYVVIISFHLCFFVTELIDLWNVRSNLKLLPYSLKTLLLAFICVAKGVTFLSWEEDWREIINYVNKADRNIRKSEDEKNQQLIRKATKFSRNVAYLYWFLANSTCLSLVIAPLSKYLLSPMYRERTRNGEEEYKTVLCSWVPWDRSTLSGYIIASIVQVYAAFVGALWIVSFDVNALAIMTFLKCEIELLRRDSAKIFGSEDEELEIGEVKKRIKECHIRHKEMMKCSKLFNSCLSPVMTLYVIVCSIMLCVTSYEITTEKNPIQRIMIIQYLVFGVLQLFAFCWASNSVYDASDNLYLGPYESLWWKEKSLRKSIHILMIQFSKPIVFTAPPFMDIGLPTFVSILKGAYSYYTILSQSSNEI